MADASSSNPVLRFAAEIALAHAYPSMARMAVWSTRLVIAEEYDERDDFEDFPFAEFRSQAGSSYSTCRTGRPTLGPALTWSNFPACCKGLAKDMSICDTERMLSVTC